MPLEHRILLVDDYREFADLLCRRLLRCGYQVTELHHPRQALEAASLRDYDVAILDRSLPEIDGLRLMQMLKGRINHLEVVFLSGNDSPADKDVALKSGAFAYLTKPCRLSLIEDTIERAIESRAEQLVVAESESKKWQQAPQTAG